MATALITGATAGIGATFARHLAARGDNLILVARDATRLAEQAEQLRNTYGIEVEPLSADLAVREDTMRVAERAESAEHPVDMVISNAGFGLRSDMLHPDSSADERALDVMCRAVMLVDRAAARAMKARGHGIIINTSSSAGFITQGHYSAVKAWATAYTESLAAQLRGTGVSVTALCPGWVHTEFHDRAGISSSSIPKLAWIDADTLVRECLADAAKGKVVSVPRPGWKAAIFLARHAPRGAIYWASRQLTSRRSH